MMPTRDSDGNDDIPIPVMFDTDIDKEEGADIGHCKIWAHHA